MKFYYCKYNDTKVIKVDWDYMSPDKYEIDDLSQIRDIEVAFMDHLSRLKEADVPLSCITDSRICILKILKNEFAYLYFYDIDEAGQVSFDGFDTSILTIRKVVQGSSGKCCPI